jgi:SHS2 domain-containing protein
MPDASPEMYEEIEHTADWAIKVRGRDIPALFTNAALGMMELAGVRMGDEVGQLRQVKQQAADSETLLVDWLHEVLLALEMEQLAFREIDLEITDGWTLVGSVRAVPIQSIEKPIKAVTYNELQIEEFSDGLEVTIVFDV